MNTRPLAATSIAVLVLGAAGSASAATAVQGAGNDPYVAVELKYLGLDKATLVAKLKQGQTLAQIAAAQGKSSQGLVDALVAAAKVKLDAQVKAGKLSKSKEATALASLRTQGAKLMTKKFGSSATIPAVYLKAILAYLQIDDQTLQGELKAGKTLGQIAVAHGKTADGLTAAIVVPIQSQLDEQVTAGKLTASQHDALLAQAQANIAKLVAGTA
jgi:D-Tyr-tRNAtyr deacylase